jgi:hypothetical protein
MFGNSMVWDFKKIGTEIRRCSRVVSAASAKPTSLTKIRHQEAYNVSNFVCKM